jgi:catechol 2,3-dioxygenase-like lactoylglutathione lyase family enzyme
MERSLEFYVNGLGLAVLEDFIVEGDLVRHVSRGASDVMRLVLLGVSKAGAGIELIEYQGVQKTLNADPISHRTTTSIVVDDLRALISELSSNGIEPSSEIFTVDLPNTGKSEIIFFLDPDNNPIEFSQLYPRFD